MFVKLYYWNYPADQGSTLGSPALHNVVLPSGDTLSILLLLPYIFAFQYTDQQMHLIKL